ncbi:hypothetical protein SD70_24315 [Gordoniibacillus kamchatkensis]|uniref:Uncharacterized protein n=1 Tax=Gordoniibacillus kamchatkensis TaxID=1590651 RepID=A0ABR5ACP1_9BACL|nr:hypothetical protein [Paenibacillus sp. VKM B-2647]KIL38806.1 hypothetical protein SD70_24315 [Paenibacillus sp. VKM B-2647]
MQRNLLYGLWMAAFGIKMLGASWDASYHFKYLRETTELPHIVNTIGLALAVALWVYGIRQNELAHSKPLKVTGLGFLLFFIAIPVDEAWHRIFGIDLTTWSPSHSVFYIGTALMIVGTILMVEDDYRDGWISGRLRNLTILALSVAVLEDFWFPLLQQEQGVICYHLFQIGKPIASEEVLQFVRDPKSQIYGGIPDWLYGVYGTFACMFVFRFIRQFGLFRFAGTAAAAAYVLFRTITNAAYHASNYPESTVPYFLVLAAFLFDAFYWLAEDRRWERWDWIVLSPLLALSIYAISLWNPPGVPVHPPMPAWSVFMAMLAAAAAYWVFAALQLATRSRWMQFGTAKAR